MRTIALLTIVLCLAACESRLFKKDAVQSQIEADVKQASQPRPKPAEPEAVNQALLPPLTIEMPKTAAAADARFDLVVNNAPANQVFMALVSGTRYSMLVHPDVKEPISVNLKDVTLAEALDSIRELYGYDYKVQGARIIIQPITIQTRLFQVNYLAGRRVGRADVRVTSGSIQTPSFSAPPVLTAGGGTNPLAPVTTSTGGTTAQAVESSRVTTSSDSDFWADMDNALRTILGIEVCRTNVPGAPGTTATNQAQGAAPNPRCESGRSVVVNAQAGVIMVRAMPNELRWIDQYLKAMSVVVERQVMLEAKIIEVSLSNQFATGINWASFKTGPNSRAAGGLVQPGSTLRTDGALQSYTARDANGNLLVGSTMTSDPARSNPVTPDPLGIAGNTLIGSATSAIVAGANVPSSVFGLAFQTSSFAALLNFLESQGTVHVLSSPRIATLNNQKAVIKVGNDEFFVTNVTTTTTTTGVGAATVSPTITTQPFFSGIALDVTPQIGDDDQITLHIHPSVSLVTDKTKVINLGTLGVFTLPLASSDINESDTIVRVQDGSIAAIGGLMRQQQSNSASGVPGTLDSAFLSNVFGSRNRQLNKSELVILLKVTVIKGDQTWQQQAQEFNDRLQNMQAPPPKAAVPAKN